MIGFQCLDTSCLCSGSYDPGMSNKCKMYINPFVCIFEVKVVAILQNHMSVTILLAAYSVRSSRVQT